MNRFLSKVTTCKKLNVRFGSVATLPPSTHTPLTSWHDLGHAQAGKPERDPLRFTRDRRLAAQHGLHLFGRREQLVGLAHGEMLARLGLDMVDECHQVAARLRRIVVRQIGLHRL